MRRACSLYPTDRAAYGRLCRLLTLGQRRAEKGECTLYLDDVASHADGLIFIALPPDDFPSPGKGEGGDGQPSPVGSRNGIDPPRPPPSGRTSHNFEAQLRRIKQALGPKPRLYLAARHAYRGDDRARIAALAETRLARRHAPGRHQCGALSRAPPAAPARRAHLHPREMHYSRGGAQARSQCRAAYQAGQRHGAAVLRL